MARAIASDYFLPGSDPEDIVQEAMVGLLKADRDFDPRLGVPFRSFATICIRRHLISEIIRANRFKQLFLTDSVRELDLDMFGDDHDPERIVLARERIREMIIIINQELTDVERHCLLALANGYSQEEINRQIGGSTIVSLAGYLRYPRVYNALWRARRKLAT